MRQTPLLTVNATITTLFYTATTTYLPSIHPSLPYLLEEVPVYHIMPIYMVECFNPTSKDVIYHSFLSERS